MRRRFVAVGLMVLVLGACASGGGGSPPAAESRGLQQASAEGPTQNSALQALERRMQQQCRGERVEVVQADVRPAGARQPTQRLSAPQTLRFPDEGLAGRLSPLGGSLPAPMGMPEGVSPGALSPAFRADALFRCQPDLIGG